MFQVVLEDVFGGDAKLSCLVFGIEDVRKRGVSSFLEIYVNRFARDVTR